MAGENEYDKKTTTNSKFKEWLDKIAKAVYGKDMRAAIHESIADNRENADSRLSKTGGVMTGEIDMGDNQINNLKAPTSDKDCTNKKYVDDADKALDNKKLNLSGGTMTGYIVMNGNKVLSSAAPSGDNDYTNKKYVDDEVAKKEPNISLGTTSQFWRGDKTWTDFGTTVRNTVLTGLSTATNAAISTSDKLITALGKLQAQITARLKLTGGTMTGDIVMNSNKVTSSAVPSTDNDYTNKKYVDDKDALKEDKVNKGAANGYAELDANGKVPKSQITQDKSDVGLGNVDNTADADKEVLSATKLKTARKINGVSFDGTSDITVADSTKEPTITSGSTSQYWKGNKTWADFASSVRTAILSGLSTSTNAAISASDSLLTALGKLQAQIDNLKATGGSSGITIDTVLSETSVNAVQNKVITAELKKKADKTDIPVTPVTPTWEQTGSCEYTTYDDLCVGTLYVDNGDIAFGNGGDNVDGYALMSEITSDLLGLVSGKLAPPTTITIASSSSRKHKFADYIAPNTASDHTSAFQSAIDALPSSGGKISILEGSYYIRTTLKCNKNVIFEGVGEGTTIYFEDSIRHGIQIENNTVEFNSINIETYGNVEASLSGLFALNGASTLYLNRCSVNANLYGNTDESNGSLIGGSNSAKVHCIHSNITVNFIEDGTTDCYWVFRDIQVYCANCCIRVSCKQDGAPRGIFFNTTGSIIGCELYSDSRLVTTSKKFSISNCQIDTAIINFDVSRLCPLIRDSYIILQTKSRYNQYSMSADIVNCVISIEGDYTYRITCRLFTGNVIVNRAKDTLIIAAFLFNNNVSKYRLCPAADTDGTNIVNSTL